MDNTSVIDINFSFNSTSDGVDCFKPIHVGRIVEYSIASLCFFVGTPAHSWLLWLSFCDGWKIKPTQVFPLNLVILELIYCSQCALNIVEVLIFKNDTLWRVIYIIFGLGWVGRPLTQICICVEQYLAVLHPIIFLKYRDVQYRIGLAAAVWLIAAAITVYETYSDTVSEPAFDDVFFIAVAVISFCCVSVLRALKLPKPGDTQITPERCRNVGNQQKRNAFNTIFTGLLITLFSYLPQVSVSIISLFEVDNEMFDCEILPIMVTFNNLGVLIPPLLRMYKNAHPRCLNYVVLYNSIQLLF